jgi:hypothetical protein
MRNAPFLGHIFFEGQKCMAERLDSTNFGKVYNEFTEKH